MISTPNNDRLLIPNIELSMVEQIPEKRLSKNGSSNNIVSFVLNLQRKEKNDLTNSVSQSIVKLDQLARSIDRRIDSIYAAPFSNVSQLSIKNIFGLENKIIDTLQPLKEYEIYNDLIPKVFLAVESSFKNNTTKRHLVYNLKKVNEKDYNITMLYLLPLFLVLRREKDNINHWENSFRAISTYIQILDDYVDIADDLKNFCKTPITNRYYELGNSEFVFKKLSEEVFEKLSGVFEIVKEQLILVYNVPDVEKALLKWNSFHRNLLNIYIPKTRDEKVIQEYLKKFKDSIPPMLCYE